MCAWRKIVASYLMTVSLVPSTPFASKHLLYKSRFCKDHEECVCNLPIASHEEVESALMEEMSSGPFTRAKAKAQGANPEIVDVVEKVLDQKGRHRSLQTDLCMVVKICENDKEDEQGELCFLSNLFTTLTQP
ncbi:hypothetical protein OS493_007113 [Desmophyllum pertusum]|uniref:Uncharacterized protein n=1 Tax=Desmophyllum pertusum TaxID=174260 RepID=A0A9W9ZG63_9CNID|nr:hypothetical protein OS493_007113 [Desmophyllum pertusum]